MARHAWFACAGGPRRGTGSDDSLPPASHAEFRVRGHGLRAPGRP